MPWFSLNTHKNKHLLHITAGGVASYLVWAWHFECLPSAAKRRRLKSHKVITCLWPRACDLREGPGGESESQWVALSIVTCQPRWLWLLWIFTLPPWSRPRPVIIRCHEAPLGVPVTRHTGPAEVRIMIGLETLQFWRYSGRDVAL